MAVLSSSSHHLHHNFRLQPPPPSALLSLFFFKPLSVRLQTSPFRSTSSFFPSLSTRPLLFSHSLSSSSSSPSLSLSSLPPSPLIEDKSEFDAVDPYEDDNVEELESGSDDFDSDEVETVSTGSGRVLNSSVSTVSKLPSLTVKEKKELASYAHSLGKKLKSQQVGKSGVTDSVVTALIETLEANELLKLKVHGTCPGELDDVVKQLEEATGSVVVGQIGRTVILYRPSMTKLKAEEKKQEARRAFVRKRSAVKPSFQKKEQVPKLYGRGRRESSRF
ncbi:hypothetical protein F0562_020523 [Nyssa sinensis]|uniref:CRM domain-containing protein n=1 Tax=Nyssa sinensis TaxID=561372 RepID=A0A5J5BTM9_9ASTE|nr:hypothetical protein F0562_020523 [Nyssa sinensis]